MVLWFPTLLLLRKLLLLLRKLPADSQLVKHNTQACYMLTCWDAVQPHVVGAADIAAAV
jgi:hypothetical protein